MRGGLQARGERLRKTRTQLRRLGLERGDALFQRGHRGRNVRLGEAAHDVLRAVRVPKLQREHDRAFDLARVGGVGEARQQLRVALHDPRLAPQLHAARLRVIHEEDEGLRILLQVSGRDELPVAAESAKASVRLSSGLRKPFGPPRCWT